MGLFELGYQFIVFLTFEVEFVKILDRGNKMSILSSYRNEYWIVPTNLNQNYLISIIDALLNGFSRSLMFDCESVELRVESGMSVRQVCLSVRQSLHHRSSINPSDCGLQTANLLCRLVGQSIHPSRARLIYPILFRMDLLENFEREYRSYTEASKRVNWLWPFTSKTQTKIPQESQKRFFKKRH